MTCRAAIAMVLLPVLAVLAPADAKDPAPPGVSEATPVVLTQGSPKPATRAEGAGAADADARACLDLPTNLKVIACAEKYRLDRRHATAR